MRLSKKAITESIRARLNEMELVDIEALLNRPLEPNRTYKINGSKFGYRNASVRVRFRIGLIVDYNYAYPSATVRSIKAETK